MLPEIEERVNFLQQVQIFNDLSDFEIAYIAERLKSESYAQNAQIFLEETTGDKMYIVVTGKVRITRMDDDNDVPTELAVIGTWDIFGQDALYTSQPRSATATAYTAVDLFYLDEEDFEWLLNNFPQVEPYLLAFARTHQFIQKYHIQWLGDGEYIHLITRRHPIRLIKETFGIVVGIGIIFNFLRIFWLLFNEFEGLISVFWVFGLGLAGLGIAAVTYAYIEWRNDFFFVTNVRVVWRERILFRSTSRQETPLRAIQSLNIQTPGFIARAINVGDLIVRTFNSELHMTEVHYPERMKDLIVGFILRSKRRSQRDQLAAIRMTIRDRLGIEGEIIESEEPEAVPPVPGKRYSRFSIFKTRIIEGNTITYRKHWSIFLKNSLMPNIIFIISLIVITIVSTYLVMNDIGGERWIFGATVIMTGITFLWWLYEYEDWRNDLYRLTADTIIDRDKKPFGQESFRSAPVDRIQSLGHEVPNIIGLILNVGNVNINVGDQTFTFEGVHDPSVVHQDIARRMEELREKAEDDRRNEDYDRMATWLEIYHDETEDQRFPWRKQDLGL